jgi:ParB family transcriptional regulator, chromosome partitioning protein
MNHRETITTPPQLIAVGKLEQSPLNVRKTLTQTGIDEMKASILAHGLMQNLVAYPGEGDVYHVVAGERRRAALRALQAEGKLPAGHAVPCQVVTEEQAVEMSLAENTVRLAMHPADEFEAFAGLIGKGHSAAQVAVRFGVEESLVLKRMKLGRVAPELLQAYRDDEVTMECLMAFALTDDHARQLAVYQSLQGWQKGNPRHIRSCLTDTMFNAERPLARFVGLDAYEAAGGTVRADLFGDDSYLENPELLHRLAADKLNRIEEHLAAEGWDWVEVNPERDWDFVNRCGRIQPVPVDPPQELLELKAKAEAELEEINEALEDTESDALIEAMDGAQARLEEIDERLADYVAFDPEQTKLAGCYVSIRGDGEPSIEKGLVRPEHRKALAVSIEDGGGDLNEHKPKGMPETLRRDLEAYRLQAAQLEIARHPAIAFDLLVFHAACGAFGHVAPPDGPNVFFRQSYPKPSVDGETMARERLEAARLSLEWLKHDRHAARFDEFRSLTHDEKLAILAYCTALTLKPKLGVSDEPTAYDLALSLTGANVADYWRPAKANYLSRITRDQLLALGHEVLGGQWAQARFKDKKGELVDQLDRAFSDPEKHGRTPERTEKLKRWLPPGMAFGVSEGAAANRANQAA